jgi:hypothetical protein
MKKPGKAETLNLFSTEHLSSISRREVMEAAKSKAGCDCPVCGQYVKVYKRTINATMARQLITAWHKHGNAWFHTRDVVLVDSAGAGDFSKLEYWGLIQRQMHTPGEDEKKSSGMWKITDDGFGFIKGRHVVPEFAIVYNGKLLEMAGNDLDIVRALGKKFNYNEIMGAARPYMSNDSGVTAIAGA